MGELTERVIIRGDAISVPPHQWIIGEDMFSSILLSIINTWRMKNFSAQDYLIRKVDDTLDREYGKIKTAINGYTSDLFNISNYYCLLKRLYNKKNISVHEKNMTASSLIEGYFTNLRSLYDFFSDFIKISLTDHQLKQYKQTSSLNSIIEFSKNPNNHDKLPHRMHQFINIVTNPLRDIKSIRDIITHKGKEIALTSHGGQIFIKMDKNYYSGEN